MSYGCDRLPPHSSRPCHTGIRSAPEPEAASFSNGRQVRQITAQPHSMASMPELPSVPTNEPDLPSQPPWFEQAIPQPLQDISDDLQPDTDIKQRLQDPELGVRFYHEQIARRQEAEAKGEDFTFAPLLVTLENMKRLTDHILANRHFPQPLTDDERDAFTRIQTLISQLTERKAPYKSTVQLAWLMMALQEMMVARHITPHLHATQPALFDGLRFWPSSFLLFSRWQAQGYTPETLPLTAFFSSSWGDLPLADAPSRKGYRLTWSNEEERLFRGLQDPRLLYYPSFEPLDPKDFCCLAHLPVYPLGMMAVHALNADGYMRTPLGFIEHDINHAGYIGSDYLDGSHPLNGLASRLCFRQRALDALPPLLQAFGLQRAVALVLFVLFHEELVNNAQRWLEQGSALVLLRAICKVRREDFFNYSPAWRRISDIQALLACLWVLKVYNHCRACPDGQPDIRTLQPLADDFVRHSLPVVQEHWRFFDRHRALLHSRFFEGAEVRTSTKANREWQEYAHMSRNGFTYCPDGMRLVLQTEGDPAAEGTVRNTELLYFDRLLADDQGRAEIEQLLGEKPPGNTALLRQAFSMPASVR